jgi:hypothetical protein
VFIREQLFRARQLQHRGEELFGNFSAQQTVPVVLSS